MNEHELRELLKLVRGIEHYIEKCLKTEQEKNEDRLKVHLANAKAQIEEELELVPNREGYAIGKTSGKRYKRRDSGNWELCIERLIDTSPTNEFEF